MTRARSTNRDNVKKEPQAGKAGGEGRRADVEILPPQTAEFIELANEIEQSRRYAESELQKIAPRGDDHRAYMHAQAVKQAFCWANHFLGSWPMWVRSFGALDASVRHCAAAGDSSIQHAWRRAFGDRTALQWRDQGGEPVKIGHHFALGVRDRFLFELEEMLHCDDGRPRSTDAGALYRSLTDSWARSARGTDAPPAVPGAIIARALEVAGATPAMAPYQNFSRSEFEALEDEILRVIHALGQSTTSKSPSLARPEWWGSKEVAIECEVDQETLRKHRRACGIAPARLTITEIRAMLEGLESNPAPLAVGSIEAIRRGLERILATAGDGS